jgi:hypothetical protein
MNQSMLHEACGILRQVKVKSRTVSVTQALPSNHKQQRNIASVFKANPGKVIVLFLILMSLQASFHAECSSSISIQATDIPWPQVFVT